VGLLSRLAGVVPSYLWIAWWGLVAPRTAEKVPLVVLQGVIRDGNRVLLSVRADLRGWELPGGNPHPGEDDEAAVRREILEETGLEVTVERHVADYLRSGFRPHTARIFECRAIGGTLRASPETPHVAWFDHDRVPDTLFPWYRGPLVDAFADLPSPVERREHQGPGAIWAGMKIDFRMRFSDDRAGLPDPPQT
jgi:8-oxo-dGTP pyrophosphatase MutT (NUDIX family)